jgi:Protein of unknown function (DUF2721)
MQVPSPNYATLSAMITPALFMTANGSLIISTSNRMSRIVDRIRVLNDLADNLDRGTTDLDYPAERRHQITEQLEHLQWRSDRVRLALTSLYVAQSMFVGTSLLLAFDTLFGNRFEFLPTGLAVLGATLMLIACVNLAREALRALHSNRAEVAFYRRLRQIRDGDRV